MRPASELFKIFKEQLDSLALLVDQFEVARVDLLSVNVTLYPIFKNILLNIK